MQTISHDRREFFVKSLLLAGAAALAVSGLGPLAAQAQTAPRPIRRSERYDDTFIFERKPFKWPGNNTLAVWFVPMSKSGTTIWPSASHLRPIRPTTCPTSSTTPGGNTECASGCGASPTCSTTPESKRPSRSNSQVCEVHPKAIEEMEAPRMELHGRRHHQLDDLAGLNPDQERDAIRNILKTIEQATGKRPRGWLGSDSSRRTAPSRSAPG